MNRTAKMLATATLAAAALAVGACGSPQAVPDAVTTPVTASAAPESANASTAPAQDKAPAFGETITTSNNLTITVSKPVAGTSEYTGKPISIFTYTVVNGTDEPLDFSLLYISAQVDGVESGKVFESGQGLGGTPDTRLRPGKTATWKMGFEGPAKGDWVMDFGRDIAYVTK